MFLKISIFAALAAVACAGYIPSQSYFELRTAPKPNYELKQAVVASKPYFQINQAPLIHKSYSQINQVPLIAKSYYEPKEAPANYDFNYEVHDSSTGDIKRQSESAQNGAIKGQYSLLDADGLRRVVEYSADDSNGFQATVKREPWNGQEIRLQQPYDVKYIQTSPVRARW